MWQNKRRGAVWGQGQGQGEGRRRGQGGGQDGQGGGMNVIQTLQGQRSICGKDKQGAGGTSAAGAKLAEEDML